MANHANTDASAGRVTVISVQAPSIIGDPNFAGRATGVFNAQEPNQLTRFGGAYTAVFCPALTQSAAPTQACQ